MLSILDYCMSMIQQYHKRNIKSKLGLAIHKITS